MKRLAPLLPWTLCLLLATGCQPDRGSEPETDGWETGEDTAVEDDGGLSDAGDSDGTSGVDTVGDVASDVDGGPSCEADSDGDGLKNCEERELCTDPFESDTDSDGLDDFEEVRDYGTDPCHSDSDGDGIEDETEIRLQLDPTDPATYAEALGGKRDGELWIADACDELLPDPTDPHENRPGRWQLATSPAYAHRTLSFADAPPGRAADVYTADTRNVAGFTFSTPTQAASESPPLAQLETRLDSDLRATVTSVTHSQSSDLSTVHEDRPARSLEFDVETDPATSNETFRNELLLALAQFDRSDVSGELSGEGTTHREFRVELFVVERSFDGDASFLVSLAVAPLDSYTNDVQTRKYVRDLANTSHVAEPSRARTELCERHVVGESQEGRVHIELRQQPITSSLRLHVGDTWIPSGEQDGYTYDPRINEITLHGDARPELPPPESSEPPVWAAVSFASFLPNCKTYADDWTCE